MMAYDADVANGLHFMVMEYVAGSDLSSLVKQHGRISITRAVNYICQAARGLEYAHAQKVIHRDIKPGNLILDQYETVRILDMGLARLNDSIRSASSICLTKTNVVMGTVDFMSPEQAMNSKYVDERGDIYSLGMTLHYLLSGKPAYKGETAVERLLAHRDAPLPSLTEFRSDVDDRLNSIFQKMVAKKPDDRYQSMVEVIRELDSYLLGTKPEPVKSESQCKEDANLKAFLLSLETVPAFVPRGNEDLLETSKMMSEGVDTDRAHRDLNLEQSVDRESIVGRLPVTDSATNVTVVSQTNNQVPFAILGAAAVLIISLLLFKLQGPNVTAEQPPAAPFHASSESASNRSNSTVPQQEARDIAASDENNVQPTPADDAQFTAPAASGNLTLNESESYALHFNGQDQYAEIPDLDLQNFPLDVPLTIEAKVCPDSFQKLGDVLSWLGPNWIRICQLTDMNEQNCWVVARRIDDRSVIISAPQTVRPGEWVDLAAVWDGREFTLFVDGKKQEVTKSAFPVEPTEGGLFLGGVPLEKRVGHSWFDGAIRQVRITRGILHETDYRPEANYSL
ncbi:MAG TPA: protein kinase, partial [Planctomycetaceae bacterium]|nr:protein kinase [Planctomycetaceae bacterium]